MDTPVLETERLRLRPHSNSDLEACVKMWSDPIVVRHTIGRASTEQRTWMRILGYLGHWKLMGYGYWAVEEKKSGKFIGELGFADFKREIEPSIKGIPELGWALLPEFHGKGYATEALLASIKWGDSNLKMKKTVCIINPDNVASLRVAEKCGYRKSHTGVFGGQPTLMFSRES